MPYGYPNTMNLNPNWMYTPSYSAPMNNWTVTPSTQSPSQQSSVQTIKVHGQEGAQAYVLPPNSSVVLLDESEPIIWLKVTDGGGYPTLSKYYITPAEQVEKIQKENQFNALESRLSNIENQCSQLQTQYAQMEEKINNAKPYSSSNTRNNSNSNSKQSGSNNSAN